MAIGVPLRISWPVAQPLGTGSSLKLHCYPRMGEGVVESIRHMVEVLEVQWSYDESDDGYW